MIPDKFDAQRGVGEMWTPAPAPYLYGNTPGVGPMMDFDGWLGQQPESVRSAASFHLGNITDPTQKAAEKQKLGSMIWTSERYALPLATVAKDWEVIRGGVAEKEAWADGEKDDDGKFHAKAQSRARKEWATQNVYTSAVDEGASAAMAEGTGFTPEVTPSFAAWQSRTGGRWAAENAANDGYSPFDAARHREAFDRAREATREKLELVRPILDSAWGVLWQDGRLESGNREVTPALPELMRVASELEAMPADQRETIMQAIAGRLAIAEKAGAQDVKGGLGQRAKYTLDRAIESLASQVMIEAPGFLVGKLPGREGQQSFVATLQDLRDLREGRISPIKADGFVEAGVLGAVGSLPQMAAMAVPGGQAALFSAYQSDAFEQIRKHRLEQGWSREDAIKDAGSYRSTVAAGINTVVTSLLGVGSGLASGSLSHLGKWAGSLAKNKGAAMGLVMAGTYVGEAAEEFFTQASPLLFTDLVAAVDQDVPGIDREALTRDLTNAAPDILATTFMFSLIGAGAHGLTVDNVPGSAADKVAALRGLGVDAATAADVVANPEKFQKGWQERQPDDAAAAAVRAERATAVQAAAATQQSGPTRLRFDGTGNVDVIDNTTGETVGRAKTARDALAIAASHQGDLLDSQDAHTLQLLDDLDRNPLAPTTGIDAKLGEPAESVADFNSARAAILQDQGSTEEHKGRAESDLSAMSRRMAVFEAAFPAGPIDWRKVQVEGQSEVETRDGLHRAVIRVADGASPYVVLEEVTESHAQAFVRSGATTWQGLHDAIRQVEQATGDIYIHGHTGGQDAAQDIMAVTEAYSSLAQTYATARGKASKVTTTVRDGRQDAHRRLKETEKKEGISASLFENLRKATEWLKTVVGQAVRLNRARRENEVTGQKFEVERFINRSLGIDERIQHEQGVMEEATEVYGDYDGDSGGRSYTPPTPEEEADGIAFSLRADTSAFGAESDRSKLRNLGEAEYDKLVGTKVQTADGRTVTFTKAQFGKPKSHSADPRIMRLIPSLPEILRKGRMVATEPEIHQSKYPNIRAWHNYLAPVDLDGQLTWVGVAAFEQKDGQTLFSLYHDHNLVTNAAVAWGMQNEESENPAPGPTDPVTNRAVSMQDLAKNKVYAWAKKVKTLDGDAISSFRLSAVASIARLTSQLDARRRDPEARRKMYEQATRALAKLRDNWSTTRQTWRGDDIHAVQDKLSAKELNKEAAYRQAVALDRILAEQGLTTTEAMRSKDSKDLEVWHRFQESKALLLEKGMTEAEAEALAAFASAAWRKRFVATVVSAQAQAKAEAESWKTERQAQQTKDWNPKKVLLRNLRILDAILTAFPPEVRAKVGGYIAIAKLTTPEAMATEIDRRIDMLDKELERTLRKAYDRELKDLIEKARPPKGKPGEKPMGKLGADGHALFAKIEEAMGWTADQGTAAIAALETELNDPNNIPTPEREAFLTRSIELINLVAGWKNADAAQRFAAIEAAEDLYEGSLFDWSIELAARKDRRENTRKALRWQTGREGEPGEVQAAINAADTEAKPALLAKLLNLSSYQQVLDYAFGRDSLEAQRLADDERHASNQYEDAAQAMADDVNAWFTRLSGQNEVNGLRLRAAMATPSMKLQLWNGSTLELSELQGIQALLMWAQEDGQRHMIGHLDEGNQPIGAWHYDQAFIDQIVAGLSPKARVIMGHIQGRYRAEHATINPLYRQRHGVNLPSHDAYAPITVTPVITARAGSVVDPVTGQEAGGNSITPSSLRSRNKSAIAQPRFLDGLQTYIAHTRQIEYWKAYYDVATEAKAIIGHRELTNSINAKSPEAAKALNSWMDALAMGGVRDAASGMAITTGLQKAVGNLQSAALFGRLSTLAVQSTQLAAAAIEMPEGAYAIRLGKLLAGQLEWGAAIKSDFIQRRIATMPPVVRQAMESMASAKRGLWLQHKGQYLGQLISGADGVFTAGTYAILLDYHKSQGLSDLEAHAMAARLTERVAQPTRMATRSLAEITATSPLARSAWAFASESRQKGAIAAWAAENIATGKVTKKHGLKVIACSWLVMGAAAAVLKAAVRDIRDDDDDEWFDSRNWGIARLTAETLAGPITGIPLLKQLIGMDGGLRSKSGWGDIGDLFTGDWWDDDEPIESILRSVDGILMAAAPWHPALAGLAGFSHLGKDTTNILDGLHDDRTEVGKKQLAREAREARGAKEGQKSSQQKDAEAQAKKAQIEAAATRTG